MKKTDFVALVGKNVEITLFDGDVLKGQLINTKESGKQNDKS